MRYPIGEKNVAFAGVSFTNGATGATSRIDTLGYDYCAINVITSTADVVSDTPSTLKVTESDDTVVTNFVAITNLTGGSVGNTSGFFVIPQVDTGLTNSPNVFRFNIDLRARKRYLLVSVVPRTTQIIAIDARLSRAEQTPQTTSANGTFATING